MCFSLGLNINDACSVKRGLNAFAKSIEPCQPELYAQADIGQNFLLFLSLNIKGPFSILTQKAV